MDGMVLGLVLLGIALVASYGIVWTVYSHYKKTGRKDYYLGKK